MSRIDADTQLAIDTLVQLGLLDVEGLKRFASLVRSLQGLTSATAPRENGTALPAASSAAASALASPSRGRKGRKGRKRGRLEITKDALRAAYATKSSAQIAAEHGVTASAVQQRLAKWKIKKPAGAKASPAPRAAARPSVKRRRRGGVELSAEVLRQAYAVKTTAEIGREYGLSPGAVQMRLQRLGIRKPSGASSGRAATKAKAAASGGRRGRKPKLIVTKEELQKAYATKSAGQIAKEYGVSRKAIERRLSKWGIKKPAGASA